MAPLFDSQGIRKLLLEYFQQNPIINPSDVSFVKREIKSLGAKLLGLHKIKKSDSGDGSSLKWSRSTPFQCLLHTITNVSENKAAFLDSFHVNTTAETNRRNNPTTARPNAQDIIKMIPKIQTSTPSSLTNRTATAASPFRLTSCTMP